MGPVCCDTTVGAVHNNLRPPKQSGNGRKRRRQKVKRTTRSSPEQRGIIDLVWAREFKKKKDLTAGKLRSLGLEVCPEMALHTCENSD